MIAKLGCQESVESLNKWSGFGWITHYRCSYHNFDTPNNKNDKYDVICPVCNKHVKIHIIGKTSANIQAIIFFIFGMIVSLSFLLLIILLILKFTMEFAHIFIMLFFIILGISLSYSCFSKAQTKKYYATGYTNTFKHKVLNK